MLATAIASAVLLITTWEGFSPHQYQDIGDNSDRIGYGIEAKGRQSITEQQARKEVKEHARKLIYKIADKCVRDGGSYTQCTSPTRLGALASLAYNIGHGALFRSALWKGHVAGQEGKVKREFKRWVKGNNVTLPGLVKRRKDEAALYFKEDINE